MAALLAGVFVLALSAGPLAGTAAATPALLSPPAITTNAWVGQMLTVTQGTYNDGPTITDEWFRCTNSSGIDSSCTTTTAMGPTYTLGTGDVGFYVKVKETATDTVAPPLVADTNVTFLIVAVAPTLQTDPRISDTTSGSSSVHQGDTLSVANGTWSRPPDRSSYQWLDCDSLGASCTAIQSATNSTYVTGASDAGHTIQVQETPHYGPTALAAATALIGVPVNSSSDPPTISGTAQQGQTLTASPGTWSPVPTSFRYQWQDCDSGGHGCATIPGATGQKYTLAAGDVGDKIVVLVTASDAGGTATVTSAATDVVQTTSTVSLTAAPNVPVTNQGVTLVATVTSMAAAGSPTGSVAFLNGGKAVSGCDARPVPASGQSVTVLCQTSFAAETAQLTASFTPAAGSLVLGSSSSGQTLNVGQATTTTALDATSRVPVQASTTYTATVAPAADRSGPLTPSGSVQFLDSGKLIPACAAQPLLGGGATCTVMYASTGSHSISARYLGDANFTGSDSKASGVQITAPSAHGTITATMQWTFVYTPSYTRVINLIVNGVPTGATVQVLCQGRGCPFAKRSRTMGKPKRCSRKQKRSCPVPGRVSLTSTFRHRNLRPGAQITVEIRRAQYVGKYYSFTMRPRKQPRVRLGCLALNATRPSAGC